MCVSWGERAVRDDIWGCLCLTHGSLPSRDTTDSSNQQSVNPFPSFPRFYHVGRAGGTSILPGMVWPAWTPASAASAWRETGLYWVVQQERAEFHCQSQRKPLDLGTTSVHTGSPGVLTLVPFFFIFNYHLPTFFKPSLQPLPAVKSL